MKRRILYTILFVCLLFVFSSSALALEGKSGPYSYDVKKNGDLRITAYDWSMNGGEDVYIPKMIDGYSVTEIGDYAFSSEDANWAHTVGDECVVIIPNTVVTIGEKAFFRTNITAMNIPDSVKIIGDGAFSACAQLRQFSVDSTNDTFACIDGVLYNKTKKELIAYPGYASGSTVDFSVPSGIKSIAPYAFYGSLYMVRIELPNTLTTIGAHAFERSNFIYIRDAGSGFTTDEIVLPSSVETIGEYSFAWVSSGANNYVYGMEDGGSSYEECDDGIRTEDRDYTGIQLDKTKISIIPSHAFFGMQIAHLSLPNTLERIEDYSFTSNFPDHIFDSVSIPASVKYIGECAFMNTGLSMDFESGSTLEEIGDRAFESSGICKKGDTFTLPDSLKTIGHSAFLNAYKFDTLVIPSTVDTIGDNICDRTKVYIEADDGSYAATWAIENGYTPKKSAGDDTSWLND